MPAAVWCGGCVSASYGCRDKVPETGRPQTKTLFCHNAGGRKSEIKVWAGLVPTGGSERESGLASLPAFWRIQPSLELLGLETNHSSLCSVFIWLSVESLSSSPQDTSHTWSRTHPTPVWPHQSPHLNYICKDPFSKQGHIHKHLRVRTPTGCLMRGTIQPRFLNSPWKIPPIPLLALFIQIMPAIKSERTT